MGGGGGEVWFMDLEKIREGFLSSDLKHDFVSSGYRSHHHYCDNKTASTQKQIVLITASVSH